MPNQIIVHTDAKTGTTTYQTDGVENVLTVKHNSAAELSCADHKYVAMPDAEKLATALANYPVDNSIVVALNGDAPRLTFKPGDTLHYPLATNPLDDACKPTDTPGMRVSPGMPLVDAPKPPAPHKLQVVAQPAAPSWDQVAVQSVVHVAVVGLQDAMNASDYLKAHSPTKEELQGLLPTKEGMITKPLQWTEEKWAAGIKSVSDTYYEYKNCDKADSIVHKSVGGQPSTTKDCHKR